MSNLLALSIRSQADLVEACGEEPGFVCEALADRFGSPAVARLLDLLVAKPVVIVGTLFVAAIVSRAGGHLIRRVGKRLIAERSERAVADLTRGDGADPAGKAAGSPHVRRGAVGRSELRMRTLLTVFTSLFGFAVWAIALLVILNTIGINPAPLLAGAGVVGVALGFGAQSIVADFLTGIFMLIEDQYGVGDVINVGEATGTVEDFSLRTTTLRDVNGTVWHFRNSEIRRVANKSQFWSRAVLDIEVAYDTDLRRAEGIIQRVADELWQDAAFTAAKITDPPEVWGIERLGADGVTIRLVVKTVPADQWMVARELRLRIKEALDEAGIEIPFPQRTIWMRQDTSIIPRGERPEVAVAEPRFPVTSDEMVVNPDISG